MRQFDWKSWEDVLIRLVPNFDLATKVQLLKEPVWVGIQNLEDTLDELHDDIDIYGPIVAAKDHSKFHMLAKLFMLELNGPKIFKLEKDDLLENIDIDVGVNDLSWKNEIFCLEFPDDRSFNLFQGYYTQCAYIAMYDIGEEDMVVLDISVRMMPTPPQPNPIWCPYDRVMIFFKKGEKLKPALDISVKTINESKFNTGITSELVLYVVRSLLFLKVAKQKEIQPEPKPKNAKALKKWRRIASPYPYIAVGSTEV